MLTERMVRDSFPRGGRDPEEWVEPSAEDFEAVAELERIEQEVKALQVQAELLKVRLMQRVGDAYGIRGVCSWSYRTGGHTVDTKRLLADHPDLAKDYLKTTAASRSFRIISPVVK
jgi:predicted phage-related endonuclease